MPFAIRNTLKAYERLKREQHIDTLFRTGKAFSVSPIKFLYLFVNRPEGELSGVRIGFTAPKKKFRRSVDRHRIVRLMREAWRLNKHLVSEQVPQGQQLHIFLIFTDASLPEYAAIEHAVVKCIEKLTTILKAADA